MVCQARSCKEIRVSYTCGGYFCPNHQVRLTFYQKHLNIAKANNDIFSEFRIRLAMKRIRDFDSGHQHRFLTVKRMVMDILSSRPRLNVM